MKVRELMEVLSALPPDREVVIALRGSTVYSSEIFTGDAMFVRFGPTDTHGEVADTDDEGDLNAVVLSGV